jgi:uracil-DNA glycosylase
MREKKETKTFPLRKVKRSKRNVTKKKKRKNAHLMPIFKPSNYLRSHGRMTATIAAMPAIKINVSINAIF